MRLRILSVVVVGMAACLSMHSQITQITTLAHLQDCIGAIPSQTYSSIPGQPLNSVCQLAPGTYTLPYTNLQGASQNILTIGRSNFTITGTMAAGPSDTILRRGNSTVNNILNAASSTTGATIEYLTFDGNRYKAALNCLPANDSSYIDVSLSYGGTFSVTYDDFINAPGTALLLGGGSTVTFSNFGLGGQGYGPNSQSVGTETGPQTATRSTAAYMEGSNNGAWYNTIDYAGTAGISLEGSTQYAYGNSLNENRYEMPDGVQGGQLYVAQGSTNASVTGNVINGNYWSTTPSTVLATGCSPKSGDLYPNGIEAYGTGHYFYNNEVEQHLGSGIQMGGGSPTENITISSNNPWDPSDTPRYVESNTNYGIVFLGPPNFPYATNGVTFNNVLVQNNAGAGFLLESVTNNGSYEGFINDSCMSGNAQGNVDNQGSTLSHPTPASYSIYNEGGTIANKACPPSAKTAPPA